MPSRHRLPLLLVGLLVAPSGALAAADVIPHRAVYRMSMSATRTGQQVVDVTGRMLFEWADACDGWAVEQQFLLSFIYAEGHELRTQSTYSSWEAKDGLSYRFSVRKLVNGAPDEEIEGRATLRKDGGGVATYAKPEAAEVSLPEGTIFPTAHTLQLLERGVAGEAFYAAMVFDGSEPMSGASEIGAAIGPQRPAAPRPDLFSGVDLIAGPMWPIRLAFFEETKDETLPKYEMDMQLLATGIARELEIDYGDFAVHAVLEAIERLPAPTC